MQAIALAAERIMLWASDCIIAGGTESMSMVAIGGNKYSPNPWLMEHYPEAYMTMGMTAEQVAQEFNISREDQDEFGYRSHMKAIAAIDAGEFKDEIVAMEVVVEMEDGPKMVVFDVDEGPRRGTTLEKVGTLKPAFKEDGTVTPGNWSQMSDGAAAVMVMERAKAESLGLKPMARILGYAVAGVRPEVTGIGPVEAIPKALRLTGLTLLDMDIIELNEAFAAQSLAVIREMGLDTGRLNVNGGAIALGHPLGCTGAKLTVRIIHEMLRKGHRYGMVTICIGGGMGAAGIIENLNLPYCGYSRGGER